MCFPVFFALHSNTAVVVGEDDDISLFCTFSGWLAVRPRSAVIDIKFRLTEDRNDPAREAAPKIGETALHSRKPRRCPGLRRRVRRTYPTGIPPEKKRRN
eukprot:Hpha_TRINITY_DN11375_c0_g1::TRINITY_DN11375_c0_g1_i1::g.63036::m.63036